MVVVAGIQFGIRRFLFYVIKRLSDLNTLGGELIVTVAGIQLDAFFFNNQTAI